MTSAETNFTDKKYAEAYPPGVEHTYWHVARARIIERQLLSAECRRILDVGCGRGVLVEYLSGRGIDCYGVDTADVEVPERLKSRIVTGTAAENLSADIRLSIDTIILGDVIEHIPDPVTFLRNLLVAFPFLRLLVVVVPARPELWSNYDEHYGHYRRYELTSLGKTVEAAGFAVSELRYMFRLLYLPARILLALCGRRAITIRSPGKMRLAHRLAAALIEADFAFLPAWVYGTSVMCRAVVSPRTRPT